MNRQTIATLLFAVWAAAWVFRLEPVTPHNPENMNRTVNGYTFQNPPANILILDRWTGQYGVKQFDVQRTPIVTWGILSIGGLLLVLALVPGKGPRRESSAAE